MYPNLSFSSRLEVERLFHVAEEIDSILTASSNTIEDTIKAYSVNQAEQGYYGVWYSLEQSQKITLQMPLINYDYVTGLVNAPVAGKRLSKRLYEYRDLLAKNVTNNIIQGLFEGNSYAEIAKRVSEETEANYRNALRIVVTEGGRTNSIAAQHSSEKAKELGINMQKRWVSTLDSKTRHDHQELDGQTVDINDDFEINGHTAKQPRMFGIASEDVRCRCTTVNIVNGIAPETRMDNESGTIVSYRNYNQWLRTKKDQVNDAIINLETPNNIAISNVSKHFAERMAERGLNVRDIKLAITNPITISDIKIDDLGRKSLKQVGHKVTISINPETGNILTAYKTNRRIRKRSFERRDNNELK